MKHLFSLALSMLLFATPASTFAKDFSDVSIIDNKTSIDDDRTEARRLLTKVIQEINDSLPEKFTEELTMNSAKIEGDYLVFTFIIDTANIPFELFRLIESEIKTQLFNEILDLEGGEVRNLLVRAGFGSKVVFKDKNSDASHTFRIEVNEISMGATAKDISKGGKSEAYEFLRIAVDTAQKVLQTAAPEMKDLIQFSLVQDWLTVTMKIDDKKVNLDEMKQHLGQISPKDLAKQMNLTSEIISLCKKAEVGIKIVFQDTESPKYVEFVIPYKDL